MTDLYLLFQQLLHAMGFFLSLQSFALCTQHPDVTRAKIMACIGVISKSFFFTTCMNIEKSMNI